MFYIILNINAQQFEIIETFSFGDPFDFTPNWDRIEGYPLGPSKIYFHDGVIKIKGTREPRILLNLENENIIDQTIEYIPDGAFQVQPTGVMAYGNYKKGFKFSYNNNLYSLSNTGWPRLENLVPFITQNYVFAQTLNKDLISWELLENGDYVYRNVEETTEMLELGLGELLGHHKGPYGSTNYFGDFTIRNYALNYEFDWKNYNFTDTEYYNLRNLKKFGFLGYDKKGINYFFTFLPEPLSLNNNKISEPFQILFAFVDVWTKKVYFRELPINDWTPILDEFGSLIGQFPRAIHPNGDIYFFDADEDKEEYQLKKLTNNWWEEIGVSDRKIARINSNHIPFYNEQDIKSNINGFCFENEFVWIQSEGGELNDDSNWIHIQKIDGRKGWILDSDIYWEQ